MNTWKASHSPAFHSAVGVLAWWWWGPSGNAQSVLSHSCCHHLSQYFTVLWTQPALELSVSLWSVFGNISQHFIYYLRARPVPYCGRCVHSECATIQAYQLTDFKRSRKCMWLLCPWVYLCQRVHCVNLLTFHVRAFSRPKHLTPTRFVLFFLVYNKL